MRITYKRWLFVLIPLIALAIWIDLPSDPAVIFGRPITTHLGLDLVGGLQVLLEADVPADMEISAEAMDSAREIIESRANGLLGVSEVTVQATGDRRIMVELPGESDVQAAIDAIGETGQLEFVDLGNLTNDQVRALTGQIIQTDYLQNDADADQNGPVFHTIMTGESLKSVMAGLDQINKPIVVFELDSNGAKIFGEYTTNNIGSYLAITLDKEVISAPQISTPIIGGNGQITGNFTREEIDKLVVQLRYGSLPIPLVISQSRTIGPSLGQDSLEKSLVAGVIGLGLVLVFMAGYYRLLGLLANIALIVYVIFTIAFFKLIPITLTLPGIAGFVLSIGVAVDANVLIFERMREELKAGRTLSKAINLGWERAWPSIRDSNLSTLITCAVLFWFGGLFGANIVKGFSVTLALGVFVSLITAIGITRIFLHLTLDNIKISNHRSWFGVEKKN